jgi:chloride channel protein, CIC family
VSLGSGASLGPEDPAVEIGGATGEWLGRRQRLDHGSVQALVASGAAGGISALLYTPLAGILFAGGVFAVRVRSRTALLVLASSLIAWAGMLVLGPGGPIDLPVDLGTSKVLPVRALSFCLVLGLLAGLISVVQIRLTYGVRRGFLVGVPVPRWLKPATGGLVIGIGGLLLPHLLFACYTSHLTARAIAKGSLYTHALNPSHEAQKGQALPSDFRDQPDLT